MKKSRIPIRHWESTKIAMIAAGGAGPLGAFSTVADVASIASIWGVCLYKIAGDEGYSLDKDSAVNICKSALLGMGGYYAGCKIANKIFLFIPGAGLLMGMGVSAVANILFTYRFALTLCVIFNEDRKDALEIGELAEQIKSMYCGNGIADDVRQIIEIWSW